MISEKKLFLLDIDGTICKGNQLIDGAKEFIEGIKKNGGKYVFITNNATKSIRDYIRVFENLGIESDETNYITASFATVQYLKKYYTDKLVYVLGTESFIKELQDNHIQITTDHRNERIACVLISYDNQLTYDKIQSVCELLTTKDIDYIATNPDLVCPIEFGYVPDCGAICEMIEHAVKKRPYFIGKPETEMVDYALKYSEFSKKQTLLVGDRLYTDILCGKRAGIDTALVLTGEGTIEEVEKGEIKPNYIFQSVTNVYENFCR